MANVDQRVVEMKFDNGAFERGVSTTLSTLDKLKSKLNFGGAVQGLNSLNTAASRVDLSNISHNVEGISAKFSAMEVAGVTALATIANKAVNTGINIVKSLTIGPLGQGFSDYNAKLTSVQTVMNSTGKTSAVVSKYFNVLDDYADDTIFRMSDMTSAFAKFTNAGIDLKTAVPAIKGIGNLTALAGQGAEQASIAYYNLSQSLAGGFLSRIDFKSLELANIATKGFKTELINAAMAAGDLKKIGKNLYSIPGSKKTFTAQSLFTEGLQEQFIKSNTLIKVLDKYGDTTTALGKKAQHAAQDVRSLPMMMDTLKASVGTQFTKTFELLFGDVGESTQLFTSLSNAIQGIILPSGKARNALLETWKGFGGRTVLLEGITNAWRALKDVLGPIAKAFREVFPRTTAQQLFDMTAKFRDFTAGLRLGKDTMENLRRTFSGIFSIIKIFTTILGQTAKGVFSVFGILSTGAGGTASSILEVTAKLGDFATSLQKWLDKTQAIQKFFAVFLSPLKLLKPIIGILVQVSAAFADLLTGDLSGFHKRLAGVGKAFKDLFVGILGRYRDFAALLSDGFAKIGEFFNGVADRAKQSGGAIGDIANVISNVANAISRFTGTVSVFLSGLIDYLSGTTLQGQQFLDRFGSGNLAKVLKVIDDLRNGFASLMHSMNLSSVFANFKSMGEKLGKPLIDGLTKGLQDSDVANSIVNVGKHLLNAFKEFFGIHSPSTVFADLGRNLIEGLVVGIVAALGFLKDATVAIGKGAVKLIGALFTGLINALKGADANSLTAAFDSLLLGGIFIVASKFVLNFVGLFKSIQNVFNSMTGVFKQLTNNLQTMQNNVKADTLKKIAVAIAILVVSLLVLTRIDPGKLKTALEALTALFVQLSASMIIISKYGMDDKVKSKQVLATAFLIEALASAILLLSGAVKILGSMKPEQLARGLGAVGLLLGGLIGFIKLAKLDKGGTFSGGAGILLLASALAVLTPIIITLGLIPYENLAKGLGTLAVALGLLAGAAYLMEGAAPGAIAMVAVAGAIMILAPALALMGAMSWKEIAKGLVTLGVSLVLLVAAVIAVEGALPGAIALVAVAGAIAILAPALALLGQLSWKAIGKGLLAIAGVLVILIAGMYALTPVIAILALFSKSIVLLGAGLLLTGLGMAAFAGALSVLAVSGAAGFAVLTAGVVTFLAILPLIARQAGFAFITFIQVVSEGSSKIVSALLKLAMDGLKALQTLIPEGIRTIGIFLSALVQEITTRAPEFFAAGVKMIKGFLQTIRDNIGDFVEIVSDIIINFTYALALKAPDIAQAGFTFVIAFINALAQAIRDNSEALGAAGANLGTSLVEGMVKGISGVASKNKILGAATDAALGPLGVFRHLWDSHSPSRVFEELGKFAIIGLANGFDNSRNIVNGSASDIANSAVNSLKGSLDALSGLTAENLDMTPTITPVFDLSGVKKDSGYISDLLSMKPVAVDTTVSQAQVASTGYNANQTASVANSLQMQRDVKTLAATVTAKSTTDSAPVAPRPIAFHIETVQDGDSLLRRARATNRMLSLAEGGDSPQLERIS